MKPILFNTEMVRAILRGEKTVTRRLIKLPEGMGGRPVGEPANPHNRLGFMYPGGILRPRYLPGDILYVRETWSFWPCYDCDNEMCCGRGINYKDTDGCFVYKIQNTKVPYNEKWSPSIHMPKAAARLFLKVTDVRAERLHDMSIDDIRKEGIQLTAREEECNCAWATEDCRQQPCANRDAYLPAMYVQKFAALWDSTIKDDRYLEDSYSKNPWVWVIEFERCEKPKEGLR